MVLSHTVKPVGVGSPNRLHKVTSPYDGCRALNFAALSPRGATCPIRLNRGFDRFSGGNGEQLPREGDSILPFAPEERYVYSSATPPIPALQRSAMWYCRTPLNP